MSLKVGKDRLVFPGPWVRVVEREFRNTKTGYKGVWQVVERPSRRPIAVIAAVTPDRKLILTKTYRVPLKAWMIEICAGLIEKSDKSYEAAARRELLEELGYTVGQVDRIIVGPHNAGMQNDRMEIFLGWDAKKIQEPHLEDGEDLEAVEVSIDGLLEWLEKQQTAMAVDVKIFGLIPFLARGPAAIPPISYKRRIVRRSDTEEEVRITWPPGAKSAPHDHGNSTGWTLVMNGTVHVKTFDKKTHKVIGDRDYLPGETFKETTDEIHIVSNPGLQEAATFHFYAPPLKMTFYPNLA